jgi:hypothetical protein
MGPPPNFYRGTFLFPVGPIGKKNKVVFVDFFNGKRADFDYAWVFGHGEFNDDV